MATMSSSKALASSPPIIFVSPSTIRRRERMLRQQQFRGQQEPQVSDCSEGILKSSTDASISVFERVKEINKISGTPKMKQQFTTSFDFSEKSQQRAIRRVDSNEDSSSSIMSLGSVSALTLNASMMSLGIGVSDASSVATTKNYPLYGGQSNGGLFSSNNAPERDAFSRRINIRTPERLLLPSRHSIAGASPSLSFHEKTQVNDSGQLKQARRDPHQSPKEVLLPRHKKHSANENAILINTELNSSKEEILVPRRRRLSISSNETLLANENTVPITTIIREPYPRCITFPPPSNTKPLATETSAAISAANVIKRDRLSTPSPRSHSKLTTNGNPKQIHALREPYVSNEETTPNRHRLRGISSLLSHETQSTNSSNSSFADRARLFGDVVSPRKSTQQQQRTPSPMMLERVKMFESPRKYNNGKSSRSHFFGENEKKKDVCDRPETPSNEQLCIFQSDDLEVSKLASTTAVNIAFSTLHSNKLKVDFALPGFDIDSHSAPIISEVSVENKRDDEEILPIDKKTIPFEESFVASSHGRKTKMFEENLKFHETSSSYNQGQAVYQKDREYGSILKHDVGILESERASLGCSEIYVSIQQQTYSESPLCDADSTVGRNGIESMMPVSYIFLEEGNQENKVELRSEELLFEPEKATVENKREPSLYETDLSDLGEAIALFSVQRHPETQTCGTESLDERNSEDVMYSSEESSFEQNYKSRDAIIENHNHRELQQRLPSDTNNVIAVLSTSSKGALSCIPSDYLSTSFAAEPPKQADESLGADFDGETNISVSYVNDFISSRGRSLMTGNETFSACSSPKKDSSSSSLGSATSLTSQAEAVSRRSYVCVSTKHSLYDVTIPPDDFSYSGPADAVYAFEDLPGKFKSKDELNTEAVSAATMESRKDEDWAFGIEALSFEPKEQVREEPHFDDRGEDAAWVLREQLFCFDEQREIESVSAGLTSGCETFSFRGNQTVRGNSIDSYSTAEEKKMWCGGAELLSVVEDNRAWCMPISVCTVESKSKERIRTAKKTVKCINCQCLQLQQASFQQSQIIGVLEKTSSSEEDNGIEPTMELLLSPSSKKESNKSIMKKTVSLLRTNLSFSSPQRGAKSIVKFIATNAKGASLMGHHNSGKAKKQLKENYEGIHHFNTSAGSSESSRTSVQPSSIILIPEYSEQSESYDDDDSRKLIQQEKRKTNYYDARKFKEAEHSGEETLAGEECSVFSRGGESVLSRGGEECSVFSRAQTNSTSKEPGSQCSTRSI